MVNRIEREKIVENLLTNTTGKKNALEKKENPALIKALSSKDDSVQVSISSGSSVDIARESRIAEIKKMIAEGSYKPDTKEVAKSIVDELDNFVDEFKVDEI